MIANFPRPTLFAHRGSSNQAPENTISAFELAVVQAADAIEFDVQLSSDHVVVVMHDSTVNRTTNGIGKVSEMTLASLKQLDAGAYFDSAFQKERIPTLNEVFEAVGNKILMNIELKLSLTPSNALPLRVAQAVTQHKMADRVLFSSYDPIALWRIKEILPEVPCGLLALPGSSGWAARAWGRRLLKCEALHPHFSSITEKFVKAVHQSGQRLNVYTVNKPEDIKRMLSLGVDGIITDSPDQTRKIFDAHT